MPGFVRFEQEEIEQSIPQRFAKQVLRHRDRIAVKSARYTTSYEALDRWSNRVAHAVLGASGTEPAPVALLLERDAPHVAAILGVLKAGMIYVPLAPSYPLARNQLILDDSEARLILTDAANRETAAQLGGATATVLNLDELDPALPESDPGRALAPDAYAYILYTSGSTGRPKGIVETHRNILHNMKNFTNDHYINHNDRIAGLSSFAFSGSLKDLFGSLLNGGALYPLEIEHVGLHVLAEWLAAEEITIYSSVSTTFRHFASLLSGSESFPCLRVIRIGSEEVTRKDVALYQARFPRGCVLVNGYGATETGSIRVFMIDHDTRPSGSAVPIGYPVEGLEVRLIDDEGQDVGVNQVGQIAVRSKYLSAGYWRQPDLTRRMFLDDPEGAGQRIYLTGDLGVMAADGCLTHAGRKDFQVKVRGNRVEVSEIETALRDAPGVAEAVVMARKELPEDSCLVAYVVPQVGSVPPSTRTVRSFLKARLPDSSIPSAFVWLDAIPLTPSGKTDRKGLPAPTRERREDPQALVAARTELEERLVAIWEELTENRPIGVQDDFFELGGNSLLAARMFAEIHKSLGRNLPIETLLSAPTIERLARVLADALASAPRPLVIALKAQGSLTPFFAIPGTVGHPLSFYELARLTDPEQPFFGLLYPDPTPEDPYPTRIEDLAARFLPEIQKIQPHGPYRLGGHSLGGAIAFELAHQLQAQGHEVSLVALFDTWGKGYPTLLPLPGRLIDHLRHVGSLSWPAKVAYARQKTALLLRRLSSRSRRPPPPRAEAMLEAIPALEDIGQINHIAWLNYRPRPYCGKLVVFRAEQPRWIGSRFDDPHLGWGDLATEGIDVHPVGGDHLTLFDRANVSSLAHKLNGCLRK